MSYRHCTQCDTELGEPTVEEEITGYTCGNCGTVLESLVVDSETMLRVYTELREEIAELRRALDARTAKPAPAYCPDGELHIPADGAPSYVIGANGVRQYVTLAEWSRT